jgi:hypothetical protein
MEAVMAARKRPFTGLLRKPIRLDDAKPGWLKPQFALPRDEVDVRAFAHDEYCKRLAAFDQLFGIDSNNTDCWEQRVKALLAHTIGVRAKEPWKNIFWHFAPQHIPGFKFKLIGERKSGQPPKWTDEILAKLFADVEFLKRKTGLSTSNICNRLPSKMGYEERWKSYIGGALRKAYLEAKKRRHTRPFEFILCGPHAVFSLKSVDLIAAAIEMNALKH